jgi:hypothetical protein
MPQNRPCLPGLMAPRKLPHGRSKRWLDGNCIMFDLCDSRISVYLAVILRQRPCKPVRSTRMAFIKCSACSREVSDKVAACPGCGAPLTPIPDSVRFTRKGRKWDGIGFALVLLGIVIGMVSNVALGWAVALAGLAVFIVGRFK